MKISMSESPVKEVFGLVSNPLLMSEAFPESVKKMEVLSEHQQGVGARFRETRLLRGREDVIEIETIEYVENEKVLISEPILQHDGGMQEIFFHDMKVAEFHELSRTLLENLVRQR